MWNSRRSGEYETGFEREKAEDTRTAGKVGPGSVPRQFARQKGRWKTGDDLSLQVYEISLIIIPLRKSTNKWYPARFSTKKNYAVPLTFSNCAFWQKCRKKGERLALIRTFSRLKDGLRKLLKINWKLSFENCRFPCPKSPPRASYKSFKIFFRGPQASNRLLKCFLLTN